jgi:hypothetical protein
MTAVTEGRRVLMPIKDLFEYDPEWTKKRDKAIKKLFNDNIKEFNEIMSRIEPLQEWKDVMDVIDVEFNKRKIKADTKEATGLTDVLFKRYYPTY